MENKTIKFTILLMELYVSTVLADKAQVCFFEDDRYHGNYFCVIAGKSEINISPSMNDKISSIKVPFGMEVIVYKDNNFSGTETKLTDNIDKEELTKLNLHDEISSFKVTPASCFYSLSDFSGESICLSTGKSLDIYNENKNRILQRRPVLPVLNDNIDSIEIPEKTQVKIYSNDSFKNESYELIESINYDDLLSIGMNERISSIRTREWAGLSCNLDCVILDKHNLDLAEIFSESWHDSHLPNKQLLLSFNKNGHRENFDINISKNIRVSKEKNVIIINNTDTNSAFLFYSSYIADTFSLLLQIKDYQLQIMYLETLKNKLIKSSPLISYEFDFEENNLLKIKNLKNQQPLIMKKAVAIADNGQRWSKRDGLGQLFCWSNPLFNVYNYIIQGRCNQLDNIVYNITKYLQENYTGKSLHIAGEASPLSPVDISEVQQDTDSKLTLTYINSSLNKHSISLPATAKACRVSLYPLLSVRQIRQIRPSCVTWTLDVLTDFTLLFGHNLDRWNSDYFGQVIESIIKNGNTGSDITDMEVEKRFINSVKIQLFHQEPSAVNEHLKSAFDYAQLSYTNYITRNDSESATLAPQAVEQLQLGIYELDLINYIHQETIPRIYEQGHWVLHPELTFEVEIFEIPITTEEHSGTESTTVPRQNEGLRQNIMRVASQWTEQYESSQIPAESSTETIDKYNKLVHAGRVVTGIIQRRLQIRRGGEIFVVVKLLGEVITIALADSFLSGHDIELVATATNPRYVLTPDADNTVREGGTVATRYLANYLKQKGARALIAEVISHPSARVKQKVGFNFKEEF
ncbi:peptidase inhibitor family I36 protein [Yersinia pekkanenii]|uniref:N-acetyltransferase GCN5 n=1 Tax=Yersinia pekkanenii TaxID=1288385 RepID=A0A0T9P8W3_9GAMM|nr:peptidase inhibitor family I36 protein [Yersinia pekkanenii]CNH51871.1 N-acetyltransferase GCN5 [Yersinia pekkanenii]CRY67837.1 N-acetyltransferase GCN5 [Yersinia pekkanenii]